MDEQEQEQAQEQGDSASKADGSIKRGLEHIAAIVGAMTADDLRIVAARVRRLITTPVGMTVAASALLAGAVMLARSMSKSRPKENVGPEACCEPADLNTTGATFEMVRGTPIEELIQAIERGDDVVDVVPYSTLAAIISHAIGYRAEVTAVDLLRLGEQELDAVARWAVLVQSGHNPKVHADYVTFIIHGSQNPVLRAALDKLTRRQSKEARQRERLLTLAHLVLEHGVDHVSLAQQAELVQQLVCGSGDAHLAFGSDIITTPVTPAALLSMSKEKREGVVRLAAYARQLVVDLDEQQLQEYRDLADQVDARAFIRPIDDRRRW